MKNLRIEKIPFEVLKELAQKHKLLRKQAGFTQSGLANRSGVSLGSIKRFESTGQISLESLLKLVHILNRISDFENILKSNENLKEIEKLFSARTRS